MNQKVNSRTVEVSNELPSILSYGIWDVNLLYTFRGREEMPSEGSCMEIEIEEPDSES